tara:strand:+ start:98 stop:2722 length:2625 start_codon:yes stop_codon:yes gene_type:complete
VDTHFYLKKAVLNKKSIILRPIANLKKQLTLQKMKKFKHILFISSLLSMTIFMSCTEDDGLNDLDNGDTLVNDSTGVVNDSTGIVLDTTMVMPVNFLTIDGDTTFLEGGLKYLYGTDYYGSLPMSGMTNDDGSLCMPKTQSFDMFVGGGDFTIGQIEEWGGSGEFPAEFGSGSYSAIYFWLESGDPDMADGKYMDVVQWYNQYFDPVQSESEMYEQMQAGMAMSFDDTCVECCGQMSWANMCVGDEIEDWVWDKETEEYVIVTKEATGEDIMEQWQWYVQGNGLCELKSITGGEIVNTWNDEVCAKEMVYDYLILYTNMMTITVDSSGEFSEVWYDMNNVSIEYEGISEGIESFIINAEGTSGGWNDETGEYEEGSPISVNSHYTGFIYSEDFSDGDGDGDGSGDGDGDGHGGCTEECLDIQNGWWVAAATDLYPEATVIWATSFSCEAHEYEGVIEEAFSEIWVGIDHDGDGFEDCSMTFDEETEELLRNYCESCEYTELSTDQTGYWTVYLDSTYSDVDISSIYNHDCTAQGAENTLTVYWNDWDCYAVFDHDAEALLYEWCAPSCDITSLPVEDEGYWINYVLDNYEGAQIYYIELHDCTELGDLAYLYVYLDNDCTIIYDHEEQTIIDEWCPASPSTCSELSEMEQDSLGFWNAILAEKDSSFVVDQVLTVNCTYDDTGEVIEELIFTFVDYSDGHSAWLEFDGITEELNWDSDDNDDDQYYKTSIDSTQWAGWVAENYPNDSIESVYLNIYDGYSDLWIFFASDCFILIDDYDAYIQFDACSDVSEGARIEGTMKHDLKASRRKVEIPKRSAPIKGMDIGSLIKKGVVKKGLAHKAILDKNFGVKLKADKSKKPAPPKNKKARLPFKNR